MLWEAAVLAVLFAATGALLVNVAAVVATTEARAATVEAQAVAVEAQAIASEAIAEREVCRDDLKWLHDRWWTLLWSLEEP